jgi:EKC/KEOPS complex subunit CGI121/TPRKB
MIKFKVSPFVHFSGPLLRDLSTMETYTLPHFPLPYSTIHIALFHTVTNSPSIRRQLIAASTATGPEGDALRSAVDYAFLDARLVRLPPSLTPSADTCIQVVNREHLLTAIQATLLSSFTPSSPDPVTRTQNLHSELLLALSPNKNISDSVRRHGIGDTSDEVVVVRIGEGESQEQVWRGIKGVVRGELMGLGEMEDGVDWGRADKVREGSFQVRGECRPGLLLGARSTSCRR